MTADPANPAAIIRFGDDARRADADAVADGVMCVQSCGRPAAIQVTAGVFDDRLGAGVLRDHGHQGEDLVSAVDLMCPECAAAQRRESEQE